MRENRTPGSVRGAPRKGRSYRDGSRDEKEKNQSGGNRCRITVHLPRRQRYRHGCGRMFPPHSDFRGVLALGHSRRGFWARLDNSGIPPHRLRCYTGRIHPGRMGIVLSSGESDRSNQEEPNQHLKRTRLKPRRLGAPLCAGRIRQLTGATPERRHTDWCKVLNQRDQLEG